MRPSASSATASRPSSAREPDVELTVTVPKHLTIDAPRLKLVQVLTNIIRNAFEAIDGPGAVNVTASVNGAELELRVTDDGCGIAEEDLGTVFLPGISTKRKLRERTDCTGFGLAIAHKIVMSQCCGTIRIDSEEDVGTSVTILLPVDQRGEQP